MSPIVFYNRVFVLERIEETRYIISKKSIAEVAERYMLNPSKYIKDVLYMRYNVSEISENNGKIRFRNSIQNYTFN